MPTQDLIISEVVIDTPTVGLGGIVSGHGTVQNIGDLDIGDSFQVQAFFSGDNIIGGAWDISLGIATIGSLAADGTYEIDFSFQPNGITSTGTFYVGFISDTGGVITESDEDNNVGSASFVYDVDVVAGEPDLVATGLTIDQAVFSETGVLNGSVVITNTGTEATLPNLTTIYLSSDSTVNSLDIVLESYTHIAILPGESTTIDFSFTSALGDIVAGTYHLGVLADSGHHILESNENNNNSNVVTFTAAGADLVISEVVIDTPIVGDGGTVTGHALIENIGDLNIGDSFQVRLFFSQDETIGDGADSVIGTATIDFLNPGGTHNLSFDFSLTPGGVPDGTYYFGLVADSGNEIVESSEINNIGSATFVVDTDLVPDLIVQSMTLNSISVQAGESVTGSAVIQNAGQIAIGDAFDITIFFSPDQVINGAGNDIAKYQGTVTSLGAGNTATLAFDIPIAEGSLADGTYYVGVIADSGAVITETDESNNANSQPVSFTLTNPAGGQPDLVAMNLVVDEAIVEPGGTLSGSVLITNNGTAATSADMTTTIYFSTDGSVDASDVVIDDVVVPPLAVGQSATINYSYNLVEQGFEAGTYYIGVIADSGLNILESDESNNTSNIITITAVDNGATATPGDDVLNGTAGNDVINGMGGNDTINGGAGDDTITGGSDGPGDSDIIDGGAGNDTVIFTGNRIDYRITQNADGAFVVESGPGPLPESVDTISNVENFQFADGTVTAAELLGGNASLPDFVASNLVLNAASGNSSGNVSGSITVQNIGVDDPYGASLQVGIYISTDNAIDNTDPELVLITVPGSLTVAQGELVLTFDVALPGGFAEGNYQIGAIVNPNGTITENSGANNLSNGVAFEVSNAGSDLVASNLVLNAGSVTSDGHLVGTIDVQNIGTVDEVGVVQVALDVFDENGNPNGSPTLITIDIPAGLLAGAASVTLPFDVALPSGFTEGNYSIRASIDPNSTITEIDETNNVSNSVAFEVDNGNPDLVASNLVLNANIAASDGLVSGTIDVQNIGQADENGAIEVAIYISDDNGITNADPILTTLAIPTGLVAGASSVTLPFSTPLPANFTEGNYYIGAIIDPSAAITEDGVANNISNSAVFEVSNAKPDLLVDNLVLNAASTTSDGHVIGTVSVGNVGTVDENGAIQVAIYISNDDGITNTDTVLTTLEIPDGLPAGLAAVLLPFDVALPAGYAEGNYYIGAIIDPAGTLTEEGVANNVSNSVAFGVVANGGTITGTDEADVLEGTAGNDVIDAMMGADTINAGGGDDTITGGADDPDDNDTIDGGDGNDTVVFVGNRLSYVVTQNADGAFVIRSGTTGMPDEAVDVVSNVENFQFADGTVAAADLLGGNPPLPDFVATNLVLNESAAATNGSVSGSITVENIGVDSFGPLQEVKIYISSDSTITGQDQLLTTVIIPGGLSAAQGAVVLTFNAALPNGFAEGNYHIGAIFSTGSEMPENNTANNVSNSVAFQVTNDGTPGDDSLYGTADSDVIQGHDGNDFISGDGGNDIILGGNGADIVWGGNGNDTIFGGDGNDIVDGDDGDDQILGEAGDDTINGGNGVDYLYGQDGEDTIDGGDGNDYIHGGDGVGHLSGGAGNDIILGGVDKDIIDGGVGVDIILSGDGNDIVRAGEDGDFVWAGAGNDEIFGGAGGDVLIGQDGDDIINGEEGNDLIDGGSGNNTLSGGVGHDTIWGGNDIDTISGGDGNDQILGGAGDDVITGGDGVDYLSGGDGNDSVDGGISHDILWGYAGNDTLSGGSGVDQLFGGAGNDIIEGGGDNDYLFGQDGVDVFVFNSGWGNDNLYDFEVNSETLDMSGLNISFDDLTITALGGSSMIELGYDSIILHGVSADSLDSDDFLF